MKYIGRSVKFNRIVYRKYTKKHKYNIKILTFLKSNYKYKRRCLRKALTDKMSVQRNSTHRRQIRNNNEMQKEKHQLPVEEDMLKNNKNIIQRIPIYDNTKLDKFLKIFILIMQQAQLTATTINDDTRKNASTSNGLATRLVAKTKAIKNTNRSPLLSTSNVNEDEINRNHRAYKDANKDTDNNIDIGSNTVDEISHQQHNYDKVSTITSTPIKCQRRKHLQLNATKTSTTTTLSPSPSSSSPSAPLPSPTTMTTSLSSPSVVVQTNYETYQWSAILRNCACDSSPPIHHQYQYHHYHHKRKHIQHHHFYQQHQQQQHQWQQHAVHIKSLTSRSLLSDNNNNNNNTKNKSDSSSIKNNNRSHNSNTIDSPTCSAIAVYQTVDQYVNATWNRSYTISCLLLTLFIAFTIGVRSTTAGACWQTVLDNGKCNEIFSLNISKSECCGANQEFAYTEREPTNVEYFFATAIGGGMECSPCLESCKNVKCGPNKKCVKRKGRPKCICAPECGAARRRRKQREHSAELEQRGHQHHMEDLFTSISKDVGDVDNEDDDMSSATIFQSSNGFNIKINKSQQSRDIRSLSSEITNVNLGLKDGKHVMMINSGGATSQMERHHSNNKEHNQNQRKLIHVHMEEHPYSQQQQQQQRHQKSKKSIDLQQYTHQMQQHQQEDQLRLQLEQQQTKRKDQEPTGSRRLLITANVEHTEKPTTRRLQIFSNVRTTHARRRNSNKNKSNTRNNNSNRSNNKKKNKNDQHEDTDPSDTDIDDKVVENDEDYNYNDTEDNEDNIETNMKYRSSNGNGNSNKKNNINRNDDATRFLNQSLSRHKLTTNTRLNNKNSNSSSHNNSKSSDNNSKNNERKIKRRKNHDLQRTEILQHHSSDNNTRIRYPQQNQSHAVDISHHRHNRHHHRQQQQRKHNHHRQDFHNHNHHKKHNQQQQNHHRRPNGRQKFNRQQLQQTIGKKEPKHDKDYNATITVVSPIPITITPATYNTSDTRNISPFTTLIQSQVLNAALATPLINLSSSSSSSSPVLENSTSVIIVTTTPNQQIQPSRSQLLLSSSAMSSLSAATPVNSTLSPLNSGTAAVSAADDFYHSHSQNHGSKIATSSSQSPSSTSLSYSQPSVSASSESAFLPSVSAKGEGVSRHDHQHRRIQILTSNNHNNNNNNDNDDHKIAPLNSNLHNNPQQQEEQKEQQHDQQPQAHQQYFHSTLFDAISDQIDFMGFSTKQQTITDAEFDRPLNPVCGTDGRTYNTECQLRKRACRTDNPNLQIAYRGHCRTTCNGVKCLNGLTCIEDQYSMPHCIACKIECPQDDCDNDVVDATKAVCGADGKTYKSVCDINRMICKIGRSIGVAYPGPCRVEQITCDDINCGPKQVCLIDWLTHTPRCTSCRYKCSRKRRPSFPPFEEGKICGVNNRTYNSWCEMRKDSCSTGFYIDLKYSGDCH